MTSIYIRKTQTTNTEEQLQHFTERLKGILKNVLHRYHVGTHTKTTKRDNIPKKNSSPI